jgi:hypothetical protein
MWKFVKNSVITASACLITGTAFGAAPTFTKDVAPILMDNCVECHRAGQIGPMSLLSYKEVRPWAKSIKKNVADRKMPPWHATESVGTFVNERTLTQEQIDTIVNWVDAGTPRGDKKDMPDLPVFEDGGWKLGEPDMIIELPEVTVEADGPDIFKDLPGKVNLKEDRWVTAVEFLPGDPTVVHHVIAFQIRGFDPDPIGGWMGAWAAGTEPMVFPEGTGRLMKKGHSIVADMHYHPSGKKATDVTRIGLHFADTPKDIEKELTNLWVMNTGFEIPPGAPNHEVRADYTFQQDGAILGFAPHMHYRGKDFTYTANYPDGTSETLFKVDNYDFNWQTNYVLNEPIKIPEGTVIECVAHFDNSADKTGNPDPAKTIRFGQESYDEMMIGFMDYIVDDGQSPYTRDELRDKWRTETSAAHPDDTYSVYFTAPEKPTVLYFTKSGEDNFLVLGINNNLVKCPINDLTWNGNEFTAKCDFTDGLVATMVGTLDPTTNRIDFNLSYRDEDDNIDRDLPLRGTLVSKYNAENESPIEVKPQSD